MAFNWARGPPPAKSGTWTTGANVQLRVPDSKRLDSYLGVAVAQQALYRAQQSSVELRLAERANRIQLYKALGGGA